MEGSVELRLESLVLTARGTLLCALCFDAVFAENRIAAFALRGLPHDVKADRAVERLDRFRLDSLRFLHPCAQDHPLLVLVKILFSLVNQIFYLILVRLEFAIQGSVFALFH